MKEFDSFLGLAEVLMVNETKVAAAQYVALEKVGEMVEKQAKRQITHLQEETGPFPAWEELAESTIERKEAHSPYELNGDGNPGLDQGDMIESYEHCVKEYTAHIGSDADEAKWFELGTEKMPPRSVLGMAVVNKADRIVKLIGDETIIALTAGVINPRTGEAFQDRIGILNDD